MIRLAALTAIATFSIGAAPSPDYSALCAGWAGKWRAVDNSERQADGSWKVDMTDPDWTVESRGKGRCSFSGIGADGRFDVDTTTGVYVTNGDWKDGKPTTKTLYPFTRAEIVDARTWGVEVMRSPTGPGGNFARLQMTMAGDSFAIIIATAPSETGPFQVQSYTVHHRQP